jgi:hypothetical protein
MNGVFLLLTPPRHAMSERVFVGLSKMMGALALRKDSSRPALWIHQGLQPLMITKNAEDLALGLLSLNSESDMSLRVLQDLLDK